MAVSKPDIPRLEDEAGPAKGQTRVDLAAACRLAAVSGRDSVNQ